MPAHLSILAGNTSKKPVSRAAGEPRIFALVPEIECPRVGLSVRSYLVLDDYDKVTGSKLCASKITIRPER